MRFKYLCAFALFSTLLISIAGCETPKLSGLGSNTVLIAVKNGNGWGLKILQNGKSKMSQPNPVQIEFYQDSLHIIDIDVPYENIGEAGKSLIAKATARKIVLNLLKQEDSKKLSLRTKRLKAGWDNNFLLKILKI